MKNGHQIEKDYFISNTNDRGFYRLVNMEGEEFGPHE